MNRPTAAPNTPAQAATGRTQSRRHTREVDARRRNPKSTQSTPRRKPIPARRRRAARHRCCAYLAPAPDGKPITIDGQPQRSRSVLKELSTISDAPGQSTFIEIASGDKSAPRRKYRVRLDPPRAPTDGGQNPPPRRSPCSWPPGQLEAPADGGIAAPVQARSTRNQFLSGCKPEIPTKGISSR